MANTPFTRPIPGQSLTGEPGAYPWERPPKHTEALDVLELYMERLADDEVLDDIIELVDIGVPVDTISGSLLTSGTMKGMHTVDMKLILRPLLTSHIHSLATAVGVEDIKITFDDYSDEAEAEAMKLKSRITAKLGGIKGPMDEGEKIAQEVEQSIPEDGQVEQEQPMPEVEQPQEAPQGLMAKEQPNEF